jgi:hypothetical protein
MNNKKTYKTGLGLLLLIAAMQTSTTQAKPLYLGVSLGQSKLEPKVNTVGGSITDNSDMAYKLFAGYKINKAFSVEGFYADMGAATVNTGSKKGKINYTLLGVSGQYTHHFKPRLSGFVKLGASHLSNTATNNISYKKKNSVNIVPGIGIRYDLNSKFSIQAEYENYDKDIQLLSVGLIMHF